MKYGINWNWFKERWPLNVFVDIWNGHKNRVLFYLALLFISLVGTWFTWNYAINFSAIPLTFLYLLLFIGFFELFDTKILTGIDTLHELRKGNAAVALFYVAIALVLHAVATIVG